MEQDYDIRFNRPEPGSEEIQAFQNFDALLEQFEAQPAEAKRRQLSPLWLSIAAGVALLLGAYFVLRPSTNTLSPTEFFAQRPFVDPPLTATTTPPYILTTQNQDYIDQALLQDDDTRLMVSRMQLANDRSARPVELHHRTLDEVSDFFLAGIPMAYDSAGMNMQLDATTIIDLFATAGGQRIQLVDNTSYGMDLGTTITANADGTIPVFFLYQLDTTNRQWTYLSEVPAEVQNQNTDPLQELAIVQDRQRMAEDYARRITDLENGQFSQLDRPSSPLNNAEGQPTLQLDFLQELELAEGSNIGEEELAQLAIRGDWQITNELPLPPENAFSVLWEQVKLVKLSRDRYELTLINPQRQERLIVRPIWQNDDNYISEQNQYMADLAAYEAAVAERMENRDEEIQALIQQRDAALSAADQAIAEYLNGLPEEQRLALRQQRVNFRLELEALGTFAIARSFLPATPNRPVKIQDEAGQTISGQLIYLKDGRHNSIYRYYATPSTELPLDEQSTLWTVGADGQLKIAKGNSVSNTIATRNLGQLPAQTEEVSQLLDSEN